MFETIIDSVKDSKNVYATGTTEKSNPQGTKTNEETSRQRAVAEWFVNDGLKMNVIRMNL